MARPRATAMPGLSKPDRSKRIVLLLGAGSAWVLLSGCTDPILTPDEDRSPYDRYYTLRGRDEPSYVQDPFGRRRPNLTGRLLRGSE